MRVSLNNNLIFKRQLKTSEKSDFSDVLSQGKSKLGNTGHSILIVPSVSLPQQISTGVGNILDNEGMAFFDFAKQYWGINYVQLLPEGQYYKASKNRYFPYSGSSLDLGNQVINLELLTTDKFGGLISKEDLKEAIVTEKDSVVCFENVLDKNSKTEKILLKAYKEFQIRDTSAKKKLLQDFENFRRVNKEWLEPNAIFEALTEKYQSRNYHSWSDIDKNLYNTDIVSPEQRERVIKSINESQLAEYGRFYEFKQFIADEHLKLAKEKLNQKGLKLSGDVPIGFANKEVWANPKAFLQGYIVGWGLPALNFEAPESEKILRLKIKTLAKRYDGLRLDSSWSYAQQRLIKDGTDEKSTREYGSKFLEIIEEEILKVKGKDYNLENIMHEFAANPKDFNIFDGVELKPICRDRIKIYSSFNLSNDWGTVDAFKNRGWNDGSYVLGATNHDSYPLRIEFANLEKRTSQIDVLSNILKIPKEKLETFEGFIQAKYAEPMRSKHNMFFFTDALNLPGRYKDNPENIGDYRIKIPKNYKENYFKALESGEGFNIMDALEKAFVAEGLDKTESNLFKKIQKYKKILQAPENSKIKTLSISAGIGAVIGIVCGLNSNKNKAAKNDLVN